MQLVMVLLINIIWGRTPKIKQRWDIGITVKKKIDLSESMESYIIYLLGLNSRRSFLLH